MTIQANIKYFDIVNYQVTWDEMREFTLQRNTFTLDEFWVLQHNPVFTLGLAGKDEHLLNRNHNIPVIKCDRGGQITYHAPGQIIIYTLIDTTKLAISIRELVIKIENAVINYLQLYNISANSDRNAPGVYINTKKIASIGLKIYKGCTYHGLSFNYNMDLEPFKFINVCGYQGLEVTQLKDHTHITNPIKDEMKKIATILYHTIYHS